MNLMDFVGTKVVIALASVSELGVYVWKARAVFTYKKKSQRVVVTIDPGDSGTDGPRSDTVLSEIYHRIIIDSPNPLVSECDYGQFDLTITLSRRTCFSDFIFDCLRRFSYDFGGRYPANVPSSLNPRVIAFEPLTPTGRTAAEEFQRLQVEVIEETIMTQEMQDTQED